MMRRFLAFFFCLLLIGPELASATPFTADLKTLLGNAPQLVWLQLDLRGCGTYIVQGGGVYIPRPVILRPNGAGKITADVVDETTYTCGGAVGTAYYSITIYWLDVNKRTVTGPQANYDITGSGTFDLNSATVKNAYIGAAGPAGPPGPPGPTGANGSQWFEGAVAPASGTGRDNDFYLNTSTGDVYQKQSGSWVSLANIKGPAGNTGPPGPAGANGANGATWLTSAGAPSSGIGANNDYYLNSTNGDVYQKQSGTWIQVANIAGPIGPAGSAGPVGPPGANGVLWYNGTGVPSNSVGVNGDYYLNGPTGDVYHKQSGAWVQIANLQGPAGATGAQGAPGGTTNWRGAWDSGTTYHSASYDAVSYLGSSYLSILDSTNQVPPNATYWQIIASAGLNGANGSIWYNGAGAPLDSDGSNGDYYLNTSNGDVYRKTSTWGLIGSVRGTTGLQGPAGTNGATWYQSTGVPVVGTGVNNDLSLNTSTGDIYQKQSGAWALIGNFKGPQGATGSAGANGTNGASWSSGIATPSAGLGADGDYYFNTTTSDVYRKAAGAWSVIANIKGAVGATGPQGSAGTAGTNGATWYQSASVPLSALGNNGDFDLNTATGDVYQKSSGSWLVVANIKGPAGSAAASGNTNDIQIKGSSGQLASDPAAFAYDATTKCQTVGSTQVCGAGPTSPNAWFAMNNSVALPTAGTYSGKSGFQFGPDGLFYLCENNGTCNRPTNNVLSVNTRTGAITLTSADVGLGNLSNDLQLKASQLDVDNTLAANSDVLVASQKAIKAYVDARGGYTNLFQTDANTLTERSGGILQKLQVLQSYSDASNYHGLELGGNYIKTLKAGTDSVGPFYLGVDGGTFRGWQITTGFVFQPYNTATPPDIGATGNRVATIFLHGGVNSDGCTGYFKNDGTCDAGTNSLPNVTNDTQTKAAVMPNTLPGAGYLPFGNTGGTAYVPQPMSGDMTCLYTGACTIGNAAVTPAKATAALKTDTWSFNLGADNGVNDLVNADIGPQGRIFMVPAACTVSEITVSANAGTPSVIVRKNHTGTQTNLVSATLATNAAGAVACAATGSACTDGTTKSGTVTIVTSGSANVLAAGDWIETTSGVASTGAKRLSVAVTCVRN